MTDATSILALQDLHPAQARPRFALSRAYQVLIVMRPTVSVVPLDTLLTGQGPAVPSSIGVLDWLGGSVRVEHVFVFVVELPL